MLGGNQTNELNFRSRSATSGLIGFYVPNTYKQFAETEIESKKALATCSAIVLNAAIGSLTETTDQES